MRNIKRYNEYFRINEEDDNEDDGLNLESDQEDNNNDDNSEFTDNENDNTETDESDLDDAFSDSPEDLINNTFLKMKNSIKSIFASENEIGQLDDLSVDNNYTNWSLKLKYNDGVYQYSCYIEIPLEEVVDDKSVDNVGFKMKKYKDGELLGEKSKKISPTSIDAMFFTTFVDDLNKENNLESEDDLGLEFEGE